MARGALTQKGIEPPKDLKISERAQRWLERLRSVFPHHQTFEVTINPTSVSGNTTDEQTFTVAGLTTQDIVTVNKPTHQTGLGIVGARVSAADTLAITFMNCTGSPIDPSDETYLIHAVRR